MIDIGINLASERYEHDLDAVIQRAREAQIIQLIATGSCRQSNISSLKIAEQYPSYIQCTLGIHPHHAQLATEDDFTYIKESIQHTNVVAIGETGLDFFRNLACPKAQEASFEKHLELAVQSGKPLFLHQRASHSRFLPILKEYRDQLSQVVVHCFTDNRKALYDYLDLDLHIGITGWICDERRGQHLWDLICDIPKSRLMIETDGPYLIPRTIQPKPKSNRNEPAYLIHVANKVAELLQVPTSEIIELTAKNAIIFFNLVINESK